MLTFSYQNQLLYLVVSSTSESHPTPLSTWWERITSTCINHKKLFRFT